jgi:hypothetical protein
MRGRWSTWVVALVGLCAATLVWAAGSSQYGKTLLSTRDVPVDVLAKFASLNGKAAKSGDTVDWATDAMGTPSHGNPYTIVVRTFGILEADGEASARWMPGWSIEGTFRGSIGGSAKVHGKAGERVELVAASAPVRFREDHPVAPMVVFGGSRNLKLDSVQVEVWSGIGKAGPLALLISWSPLLVGIVFLGLFLWWRRG